MLTLARFKVMVAGFLIAASVPAQQFTYDTSIHLLPEPTFDVDSAVDDLLRVVGDDLSPAEIDVNRRELRPQFDRQRLGFKINGETVLQVGDWGRYVKSIVPDLGTGNRRITRYLVLDGVTYASKPGPGQPAKIVNGDEEATLASPAALALLAKVDYPPGKVETVASKRIRLIDWRSSPYRITEFIERGRDIDARD